MTEKFDPNIDTSFEQRKKELEDEGYTFVATESLTTFKFVDGRFLAVPVCTKEEVVRKYVDQWKDRVEIDVVLIDQVLDQKQEAVYVFMRPKQESEKG